MKSFSTPRPWSVPRIMRDCVTFEGRNGTENLFLENVDGYYACQNEADARLIAAAPDLIEALQYALPYLEACVPNPRNGVNGDYTVDVNCVDRARAAIAKALGE